MPYVPELADAHLEVLDELAVHIQGSLTGQPSGVLPWQRDWIAPIYGTIRPETGRRQYQTVFIQEPKKCGKSFICGLLALFHISPLVGARNQKVVAYSNSKEQAGEVYDAAKFLVQESPALQEFGFDVRPSTYEIRCRLTGSNFKAIAAEDKNISGKGVAVAICDEIHEMKSRAGIDALQLGMAAQEEPLLFFITNAGRDGESPVYWELLNYARKVRDNPELDPSFFPLIREAPPKDEVSDEELLTREDLWPGINPALGDEPGKLISTDFYRQQCNQALEMPLKREEVLRLYLCRSSRAAVSVIDLHQWRGLAEKELAGRIPQDLRGRRCVVGIDLSTQWDLTSLTAVFPEAEGRRTWISWSWIPEGRVEQLERLTEKPLRRWIADAHVNLETTPGPTVRQKVVQRFITEVLEREFDVEAYVYDPAHATRLSQDLEDEGLTVVKFSPYAQYTESWEAVDGLIRRAELRHSGDPVLEWAAASLELKTNLTTEKVVPAKPDRKKSTRRIDPIVAGIMAESFLCTQRERRPNFTFAA